MLIYAKSQDTHIKNAKIKLSLIKYIIVLHKDILYIIAQILKFQVQRKYGENDVSRIFYLHSCLWIVEAWTNYIYIFTVSYGERLENTNFKLKLMYIQCKINLQLLVTARKVETWFRSSIYLNLRHHRLPRHTVPPSLPPPPPPSYRVPPSPPLPPLSNSQPPPLSNSPSPRRRFFLQIIQRKDKTGRRAAVAKPKTFKKLFMHCSIWSCPMYSNSSAENPFISITSYLQWYGQGHGKCDEIFRPEHYFLFRRGIPWLNFIFCVDQILLYIVHRL